MCEYVHYTYNPEMKVRIYIFWCTLPGLGRMSVFIIYFVQQAVPSHRTESQGLSLWTKEGGGGREGGEARKGGRELVDRRDAPRPISTKQAALPFILPLPAFCPTLYFALYSFCTSVHSACPSIHSLPSNLSFLSLCPSLNSALFSHIFCFDNVLSS